MAKYIGKRLSSSQLIILGFLFVIIIGCLLLMLPCSTREAAGASFIDALFTAVSSTCVTGLTVHDTGVYWSAFGQTVILIMIQVGGMGVVTIGILIARFSGKKIGLMQRSTMQESIAAPQLGGMVRLTVFILKSTLAIELIGAVALFPRFYKDFGFLKGILYAVFHSISAFCNAGFSLMGIKNQSESLTYYSADVVVNIVIMCLIVIGGIGFLTWDDIKTNKFRFKRYKMQSKVVLTLSAILIILPALYFFFFEFSKSAWDSVPIGEKILNSLFQSVTTRTAGFNTIDLTKLSETGLLVMIILMLIGGSPGSTAGGMKTTTVAIFFALAFSVFSKNSDSHLFGRRFADEAIKKAATIFLMYIVLMLTGTIIISYAEGLPVLSCLFETASAIGTVGLTLGVTENLSLLSKIILIILMFLGRVGGLTIIFATFNDKHRNISKLPQEKITVG